VPLAEEVEYLQRYIEIQKLRFAERLQISMDFPADLLKSQVPSLLLQPLVENAIKHGVARRAAGGIIRIAGARRNGCLHLSVYNDGPELPMHWDGTEAGVGLANLRTRLRILHGDAADLQMRSIAGTGVEVIVSLPFEGDD
jgi:LytS/YehU family sensor histidine kinase